MEWSYCALPFTHRLFLAVVLRTNLFCSESAKLEFSALL